MYFSPFVIRVDTGDSVNVDIRIAEEADLEVTCGNPAWQTDWTSAYLSAPSIDKYVVKTTADDVLVALAAYQIRGRSAYVYILYVESGKYYGIGELLVAYGIKYSIDHGCRGDVVFDAKTDALARHYERDFGAKRIVNLESGGPKRYMLADEDAWKLFAKFLREDTP